MPFESRTVFIRCLKVMINRFENLHFIYFSCSLAPFFCDIVIKRDITHLPLSLLTYTHLIVQTSLRGIVDGSKYGYMLIRMVTR